MAEQWMKDFDEAMRLADESAAKIKEVDSGGLSKADRWQLVSTVKRKMTMLGNKVAKLESVLQTSLRNQISEKELHRRQDLILGLKYKIKQMNPNLSNSGSARADLFADGSRGPPVETSKTAGFDNQGLIQYQREAMREQDNELLDLEESVKSTKHIALTVNEELDLHARLLDDLEEHVDHTDSQLRRAHRKLTDILKRSGGATSMGCMCLMLLAIVLLILIVLKLLKLW